MKINELIDILNATKEIHGNIDVLFAYEGVYGELDYKDMKVSNFHGKKVFWLSDD